LFVTTGPEGTIGEYTTSGATVNAALVSGLTFPFGLALSDGKLFVVNAGAGPGNDTIGEYDAVHRGGDQPYLHYMIERPA
jgi:hypothetical protein